MKLLVTGSLFLDSIQIAEIEALGYELSFHQHESSPMQTELKQVDGVICNRLFDYHNLTQFKQLKFIQLTSAGTDQLPLEELEKRGIKLFNARGVYSIPIAEWVVGKILEFAKQSHPLYGQQQAHVWQKRRDLQELAGKTALIIGVGSIGTEIARRLQAFDLKVIGVGRTERKCSSCNQYILSQHLDLVLPDCDIVILSLPYIPAMHHYFDEHRLALCKKGSVLINVSRGNLIDEKALIRLIRADHFQGVALDVFEQEPLPSESDLWNLNQVIITPHISFVSPRNKARLFKIIMGNLAEIITQGKDCI